MPGPSVTSPYGPGSRSQAMRELVRRRTGFVGSRRRGRKRWDAVEKFPRSERPKRV